MNWAERRKLTYMTIVLVVLGMIGFLVFRQLTSATPTCIDGRKNGDELGVDCGGGCSLYCANELASPKVRWVRTFQMTPSVSQSVAYIEHGNATAASPLVGYTFRLYNAQNTVIAERSGTTFLGPLGRTAIAETLIPTGNVPVARTTITFTEPIVWNKISSLLTTVVIKTDRTLVESYEYGTTQKGTRLSATLENTARLHFRDMDVVAIIYDRDDNVVTASKVLLPELPALSSRVVTFTWPFVVPTAGARIEIVPRFNPFTAESL